MKELHDLVVQYEGIAPQYRHGKWRRAFDEPIATQLFSKLSEVSSFILYFEFRISVCNALIFFFKCFFASVS
jgi:hypothetical protein